MVVQVAVTETFDEGFAGLKAEPFSLNQVDTGLATGAVPLGAAVVAGAGRDEFSAAVIDGAVSGVALYDLSHEKNEDGTFSYAEDDSFPVLTQGRVWAVANGVIAKGAVLAYDPATSKVGPVSGGVTTLAFATAHFAASGDGVLLVVQLT
jgi:hypothetical protein